MLKQFVRDWAVYGGATVLSRGISLLLLPIFTWALHPGDYGVVDLLAVLASFANVTVALEISQAVARYYADASTAEEKTAYASTALWFTLGTYTLFSTAGLLLAGPIGQWLLGSAGQRPAVQIAMISIYANGVFYLVQNQLRWELKPLAYAAVSLSFSCAMVGAAVGLVVGLRMGVLGVLLAQLSANLVGAAVGLYLARRTYRFTFSSSKCHEMLRFSAPLVPSSIAVFIALYVDRLAISRLLTLSDVGVFGVGYRIASATGLLMIGFQGALMPLVYSYYRSPDTPGQLAHIFRYFVALALLICLGLSVFTREILAIFATPAYYAAASVVWLLAPAVLLSNMYIFAPGLSIAKRTGVVAALTIAGAVLNTALNFALIPLMGIRGAALATLFSATCTFVGYMVASQRLYRVPHAWISLLVAVVASLVLGWISNRLNLGSITSLVVRTALLLAAVVLFIELGLIKKDEIRQGISLMRVKVRGLDLPFGGHLRGDD